MNRALPILAVILCGAASVLATRAASAATVQPAPPGFAGTSGVTFNDNGTPSPINGTRVWTNTGFNPAAYDELFYVIGTGPALTADGTTDMLTFNSGASNLVGGVARWTGSTSIPRVSTSALAVDTRFTLTVLDLSDAALALTPAASIDGLPASLGAALNVPDAGFKATWLFEMAVAGSGVWQAANTLYNSVALRNGSFILDSSVGGGFYYTEPSPVPLPAAAWLLLSGLGAVGAVARRRRSAATA